MKTYALKPEPDSFLLTELSEYPPLIAKLLAARGILSAKEARTFFNPDYRAHVHDPFLMKGMEQAVERILRAVREKEKIIIYSDYDADGVPGGVLLHDVFKKIGCTSFRNYIPHRHDEGFGLNADAVEEFAKDSVSLIITVDCGIADSKEIEHAKNFGIDVIVTDHHLPPTAGAPDAFAVLDPKQSGCGYPYKELCGAGVAFKLAQALLSRTEEPVPEGFEKWLLDLVGIATLSDMVPLTGENRVLAHYGLIVLRKSPRPGLQALLRKGRINQRMLTEEDVVFSITPKLNAASRMGSADVAFRLLSTRDGLEAEHAADELLHLNNERKGIVGSLVKEVKHLVEKHQDSPVIVAGSPSWRPSLLGLVANSLVSEYGKPVFLWGRDGDERIKGSCRSDGVTSVFALMEAAKEVFEEFGGHAFSGGFTVSLEKVHELRDALSLAHERTKQKPADAFLGEHVDAEMSPAEVTDALYAALRKLSPFGEGNPRPLFLFKDIEVSSVRNFGKTGDHIELTLKKSERETLRAIKFFEKADAYEGKERLNIVATLEQSNFGRRSELRLRIVDAF